MMISSRLRVAILVAITAGFMAGCGDSPSDAEAEIRAWLVAGEEAAESKDRRALKAMISPAYTDTEGNDRAAIDNLLRFYFLRQDKIALLTRIDSIDVFDGTAAEVLLTVGMAGTGDGVLDIDADARRFALELERDDDDWLLKSAQWGGLNATF